MALKLRRLSYALGAEVCDIDVSKPMSEAFFGEIYRSFLQHGILLFRDQDIAREEHIEFSRRFGELDRHDALPRDRHRKYPELLMVTNEPKPDGSPSDTKYTGRQWHSDMSFTTAPSLGSLLRCYAVPDVGGDTLFANMYLAYDALSDGMKALIANLHGIHLSGTRKIANNESGLPRADEQRRLNPPVAQPACLFFSFGIGVMRVAESRRKLSIAGSLPIGLVTNWRAGFSPCEQPSRNLQLMLV